MKNDTDQRKIYVITAPSGTGKSTINRQLVANIDALSFSVSMTTRNRRPQENNGEHYWFVDRETFEGAINSNALIEYAQVFENLYGTSTSEIKRLQSKDHDILIEIDVQGLIQIRSKLPQVIPILIMPPTMQALWERLERRGTDSLETRKLRFQAAKEELNHRELYEHFVINHDAQEAYSELRAFITEGRPLKLSVTQGREHCQRLYLESLTHKLSNPTDKLNSR